MRPAYARAAGGARDRGATWTRRQTIGAAGAGGMAALLAACSGPATPGGAGGKTAPTVSGSLTFWPEGGETNASYQAWVQRLEDFKKAFPQATVEMTETQDRDAKLVAAVAAGTPPDVAVHDRYAIAGASARGIMQDVMPLAKTAGVKGDDQQPWCWSEVFFGGKLYGLPYSTDTRMVYVNAAHLKQAGASTEAPKTLDDFVQVMRRLTVPGQRFGFIPWGMNWRLFGWGWLFGGDFYDPQANRVTLDHPKVIAALDWEVARANEMGGYEAVEGFRRQQPKNGFNDLFVAGAVSAFINSTSFLITAMSAKDLDWVPWAPPPAAGVARTHTWSGGFANVLPTGVKNPEAAFTLARYLSDDEFQRVQSKSGRLPTIKAVAKDPYWNTVDPRIKQFVDLLPSSHARPPIKQIAILDREMDGPEGAETMALMGRTSARQALADAAQRVNDAIKEGRAS